MTPCKGLRAALLLGVLGLALRPAGANSLTKSVCCE